MEGSPSPTSSTSPPPSHPANSHYAAAADGGGSDQEVMAFNLADPETLTSQLEHAQLDDTETEVLLSEALKLNARLKEVLRKQQLASPPSSTSSAGSKSKGQGQNRGQGHGRSQGRPHPHLPHNPLEDQMPRRVPVGKAKLPPITATSGGQTGSRKGAPKAPAPPNGDPHRKRQGSARRVNRPAWDDRFSYN